MDRPRYPPLDFHRGNVAARIGASWPGRSIPLRSSSLVPWDLREGGFRGESGRRGIKTSTVAVNVASLPGNLLVMLISSYKPFIIADEQLIRLPGPLARQC